MDVSANSSNTSLKANAIGMLHIVFFVVAAAAPMTAVVGATPPAFAFGSGAGVPGAFVVAGALYLVFSRPFTAMSLYVSSAGGFYEYILKGLGGVVGCAGAVVSMLAYFAVQLGIYALFSVFMAATMARFDITLPWWCWSLLVLALVTLLGRYKIEVSGLLLGVCMVAEIAMLMLLNIAIIVSGSASEGLSIAGFRPSEVFGPGFGVSMVFVLGAYVGFEATAIFAEEARNPRRTIPRATYVAVLLITVFYAFSSWAIVQFYGPSQVQQRAQANLDGFYMSAAEQLLGPWAVTLMSLLLLVSLFACLLSFHNTLNRYFYVVGKKLPAWRMLSHTHARTGSPHVAGLLQAILVGFMLVLFALTQADPYRIVFSWMSALAVLSIIAVQALVMMAAMRFFKRNAHHHSQLTTRVLPMVALVGLMAAFVLVSANLGLLTGSDSLAVHALPLLVISMGIVGAISALAYRRYRLRQTAIE
ncbi:APC family permease [Carnimonas bestiolae]|uniref:APC family permease n=1 Tax=Carnimonas bestiolae TaxID=3402172 RepID=UPI003EDBB413